MLDLDYTTLRGTTPPLLPLRDGLGAARERLNITPPERTAYMEAFYLGGSIADGATEAFSTRLLYQPFHVVDLAPSNRSSNTTATQILVAAAQTDLAGLAAADIIRHGLITGTFEGNQGDAQQYGIVPSHIHAGSTVRNLPTRLHLIVTNASGAVALVQVTLTVQYLVEIDPRTLDDPNYLPHPARA